MRDQRRGADAEHLRKRIDEKAGVPRRGHARNRRVTQAGNEIQIDQLAEHDHDHAGENLRRHGRDMAHDGALREVLHLSLTVSWSVMASSGCAWTQSGSVLVDGRRHDRTHASLKNYFGRWRLEGSGDQARSMLTEAPFSGRNGRPAWAVDARIR